MYGKQQSNDSQEWVVKDVQGEVIAGGFKNFADAQKARLKAELDTGRFAFAVRA